MKERFQVVVFKEPRSPWHDTYDDAMREAIRLGLSSYDEETRQHYLAVPVGIERREVR